MWYLLSMLHLINYLKDVYVCFYDLSTWSFWKMVRNAQLLLDIDLITVTALCLMLQDSLFVYHVLVLLVHITWKIKYP